MDSLNHHQVCPNKSKESPSPSSAFETAGLVSDMELTLITPNTENCENDNGVLPDVVAGAKMCDGEEEGNHLKETYFSIAIQVFIPFLIAGFGMVCAGLVLDRIQVRFVQYFQ